MKEGALWFYFSKIEKGDSASESPRVIQLFLAALFSPWFVLLDLHLQFKEMLFEQLPLSHPKQFETITGYKETCSHVMEI